MIRNKKLNAFTLSEMLVVLVVSSIVIATAFAVLNLVQKQVFSIKGNFSKQQQNQTLERVLWKDFNTYKAYYNKVEDIIEFTGDTNSVMYTFNTDFVLRNTDTIATKISDKTFFLDGKKVTDGDIDAITIFTEKLYDTNKIFVYKHKAADYYIND